MELRIFCHLNLFKFPNAQVPICFTAFNKKTPAAVAGVFIKCLIGLFSFNSFY